MGKIMWDTTNHYVFWLLNYFLIKKKNYYNKLNINSTDNVMFLCDFNG